MNISSLTSNPIKLPLPVQARAEQAVKAITPEVEPELSAKEKFAKAFYSREDEPWKNHPDYVPGSVRLDGVTMPPLNKEEYLEVQYRMANSELVVLYSLYDRFMSNLNEIEPDLAQKNFSFTLGDDAEIKILDPKQNLSPEELEQLTKAMNNFKHLKETTQNHAKHMMAIVDHDTERFGGKINLNLLNLHKTIDYGKIISVDRDDFNEEWLKQIDDHGEKRESPLIDVMA